MRPSEVDFQLLYELVQSIPEYMSISSIELEPTYRIHTVSDYNIVEMVRRDQSLKNLQTQIKRLQKSEKQALKGEGTRSKLKQ